MNIDIKPVGFVKAARTLAEDDFWGEEEACISLAEPLNRPNRIGSTICRIVRVDGVNLFVTELDAIDGTPVLDIKPVMAEFLPRQEVRQPAWSHELMRDYWLNKQV